MAYYKHNRYKDVGFAYEDWKRAKEAGTLRTFRAKYPGVDSITGRSIRVGEMVTSPQKGFLIDYSNSSMFESAYKEG